jgi:hypothetical protein
MIPPFRQSEPRTLSIHIVDEGIRAVDIFSVGSSDLMRGKLFIVLLVQLIQKRSAAHEFCLEITGSNDGTLLAAMRPNEKER